MAQAEPKSTKSRLDALGMVSFGLYVVVGGVFVFGFGHSLQSAVKTQNETPCRSLRPMQARITGVVLDTNGTPAAGAEVIPVLGGRGMMPVKTDPETGRFSVFMAKGLQALRVRAPKKESLEAEFVIGPSQVIDVELKLDAEGKTGGTFQELSREAWIAPEFTVQDLKGNEHALSSYIGRLVVLNFWATWCEPCITEWPQVAKLAERTADNEDIAVLAVSIDGEQGDIAPFLRRMSLDDSQASVLWDSTTKLHTQFGSEKIPDTFVIDEQGLVQAVYVNTREWGSPDALHCVESSAGR